MNLFLPSHIFGTDSGAYLVGGSVRDYLMGRHPMDFDLSVTTDAMNYAEKLRRNMHGSLVVLSKKRFCLYRVVKGPIIVDVSPMKGPGIEVDLTDRDFTINALACNLGSGRIIDTVGGLGDLERMTVRMISNKIFEADPIRLLRAHRMAICLGMRITPDTLRAISEHATCIAKAAGERVLNELSLIFACPDSYTQILKMADGGVLEAFFPEFKALKNCLQNQFHHADVWQHTLHAYQVLEALFNRPATHLPIAGQHFVESMTEASKILLKLAILLHDIGKPACRTLDKSGQTHFYGHADLGARQVRRICKRLRMSNHQRDCIEFIVKHHQWPLNLYLAQKGHKLKSAKPLGRFLRKCGPYTPLLLLHAMADCLGKTKPGGTHERAYIEFIRQMMDIHFDRAGQPKLRTLLNGNDLQDTFDLAPSPLIGRLLRHIEEARLAGIINDRDQALQLAKEYLASDKDAPVG
jgi:tRNA nucleotidyltransferase/poly(A) polymerase